MFISLKRYLSGADQELADSLFRMARLLLEAIRVHAVVGDQADHEKFQKDIARLEQSLEERFSPSEVLVVAGAAAKTLEDYNQRTTRFVRMQSAELQSMLAMLTDTVAAISAGSERSVTRLQTIEKQLERASVLEDIRSLKSKLSECLQSVREEARRQREETARTITELKNEIKKAQQRRAVAAAARAPAAAASSMGRVEAEEALARALQQGEHVFAALFVVDRVELISARFGPNAGEQLVQFFRHHLAEGLLSSDAVYRWGVASFLVLLDRPYSLEETRAEVQRIASVRLEKTIQIGTRTVLLPVTSRWSVLPVFEFQSLRELIEDIDAVAARPLGAAPP